MVYGIGTDILKYGSISKTSLQKGDPFYERVYSKDEHLEAKKRRNPELFYYTRFAAKEAIYKALKIDKTKVKFNEIEILSDEVGKPYVKINGDLKDIIKRRNIYNIAISISYDTDYFVAFALIETKGGLQ